MSRHDILAAIKHNKPALVPLPKLNEETGSWVDDIALFKEMTRVAGGDIIELEAMAEVKQKIKQCFPGCKAIYAPISEPDIGTVNDEQLTSAHELASVDVVVCEGRVAIAENGAVWVNDESIKFRAAWFITQHLVLLVKKQNIVGNMLEAYQKIKIQRPGFGCFIAGPSKTADIEQSLVIGAHGARSMTIFLLDH